RPGGGVGALPGLPRGRTRRDPVVPAAGRLAVRRTPARHDRPGGGLSRRGGGRSRGDPVERLRHRTHLAGGRRGVRDRHRDRTYRGTGVAALAAATWAG